LRRAEGGAKFFGVFYVKNHDFMQNNHIFSNSIGSASDNTIYGLIEVTKAGLIV
jgi:hypothetical protein